MALSKPVTRYGPWSGFPDDNLTTVTKGRAGQFCGLSPLEQKPIVIPSNLIN